MDFDAEIDNIALLVSGAQAPDPEYAHIFGYVPTEEEFIARTAATGSTKLYIRNPNFRGENWAALTDLNDGLLARLNRNSPSPIEDFRLEACPVTDFGESKEAFLRRLTIRYNYGETITEKSHLAVPGGTMSFDGTLRDLYTINKALSLHCPRLKTVSFFGMTMLPLACGLIKSQTLRALNLDNMYCGKIPYLDRFLQYIFIAAPNLVCLHINSNELDTNNMIDTILDIRCHDQEYFFPPVHIIAQELVDPHSLISKLADSHPLFNLKELDIGEYRNLSIYQVDLLMRLPQLKSLSIRNCRDINDVSRLMFFQGEKLIIGGIDEQRLKLLKEILNALEEDKNYVTQKRAPGDIHGRTYVFPKLKTLDARDAAQNQYKTKPDVIGMLIEYAKDFAGFGIALLYD